MKFIDKTPKLSPEVHFSSLPPSAQFLYEGKVWVKKMGYDMWGRNAAYIGGGESVRVGDYEPVVPVRVTEVHYEVRQP